MGVMGCCPYVLKQWNSSVEDMHSPGQVFKSKDRNDQFESPIKI
jgi:hypothetical protein